MSTTTKFLQFGKHVILTQVEIEIVMCSYPPYSIPTSSVRAKRTVCSCLYLIAIINAIVTWCSDCSQVLPPCFASCYTYLLFYFFVCIWQKMRSALHFARPACVYIHPKPLYHLPVGIRHTQCPSRFVHPGDILLRGIVNRTHGTHEKLYQVLINSIFNYFS